MSRFVEESPTWMKGLIGLALLGMALFIASQGQSATPAPTPVALAHTATPAIIRATATATNIPQPLPPLAKSSPLPTPQATAVFTIPVYTYTIVNTYSHDRDAFTQGLIYVDGLLFEGTGLYGRSTLRRVTLETGRVEQIYHLPPEFFGEGITLFEDKIYQLTWKSRQGFVYDSQSFNLLQTFAYPTQGWGITHDGERLIMSDGSSRLYFWEPATLDEIGWVEVFDNRGPVTLLNELEYIDGEVFANVWKTNRIARINPQTGQVTGWIVLDGLLTAADRSEPVDVLNGIAYDAAGDRLFITGKFWPKLFEIKLIPVQPG